MQETLWNNWVANLSPKYPHEKVIQFVFRNFPRDKAPTYKFLDLGCGNGVNSLFLNQEGYRVYGLDIASEGIKSIVEKTKLHDRFKVGSIENIDFPENFFDGLICVGVLETVPSEISAKGVREAFRVMAPSSKGLFLFSAKGDFREGNSYIIKTYDEVEVNDLFKQSGINNFFVDEYITTYQNQKVLQKDWLVTVFK